ncbi:ABC transporter permease [Sporolactobacillus pectinivorans]|uniref:ABC transporter permease n=1 Tax=Sporolactobacillus pectinivorans TaxID=1591408 RepID=UPI000C256560|nr:ABC transporter permease [Sporolactobacillus pectinivorans]
MLNYIENNGQEVGFLFLQHVEITFLSLAIAVIIALPLGILLSKSRWAATFVLPLLSVIYTIPSLALFALLIPIVGLGMVPAIIALVAYSLLILVRNVVAGFHSIDPAILEAGRGMGLDRWQMLFDIELVIALPVIIGGMRIAAVSVIGIATIASWINAGGLGVMLFQGLSQDNIPEIIWGTILVAGLAIAVNYLLAWLESKALAKAKGEPMRNK